MDVVGDAGQRNGGVERAVSRDPHDLEEAVLVDWEVGGVPRRDPLLVQVDDVDQYLRVVVGYYRCRGPACCAVSSDITVPGLGRDRTDEARADEANILDGRYGGHINRTIDRRHAAVLRQLPRLELRRAQA